MNVIKIWSMLLPILIGYAFLSFPASQSQKNVTSMIEQQVKISGGANLYQKNHKQFKYFIESIGMVSIDNVELNENTLTAIYSYKLGNEVRHVVSELIQDNDGIYKGVCTTKVNGKVLFAVNTWLTFANDGTAIGNWSWSGAPSNNDPIVQISKI